MSKFIQLHLLTSYAPSNLNRDDLGRPKTAKMGGFDRLRVSSQSLKRNWRISEIFGELFGQLGDGERGRRTKFIGSEFIYEQLVSSGLDEEEAKKWSAEIQFVYGEPEDKEGKELLNKQLVFLSKNEELTLSKFAKELGEYFTEGTPSKNAEIFIEAVEKKNKANDKKKAKATFIKHIGGLLFEDTTTAVDIALFGRMLASSPEFNVEAACQVAHSISVHKVLVEDDYFTAVDDLNDGKTDTGSAHIGEANFAAALFYSYICINKSQLVENLGGNEALADSAIKALTEAAVKVSPKGKQNSFASRAYASYVMAELGEQQPRSLSVSYLKPVQDEDMAEAAITAIEKQAANFDAVYGKCADARYTINAVKGEGTLNELLDFVAK